MAEKIDESLRFMKAIGVDTTTPTFTQSNFYTAHECLLLPYEEALTRQDSITDRFFGCSSHMLWVGERTRQVSYLLCFYPPTCLLAYNLTINLRSLIMPMCILYRGWEILLVLKYPTSALQMN